MLGTWYFQNLKCPLYKKWYQAMFQIRNICSKQQYKFSGIGLLKCGHGKTLDLAIPEHVWRHRLLHVIRQKDQPQGCPCFESMGHCFCHAMGVLFCARYEHSLLCLGKTTHFSLEMQGPKHHNKSEPCEILAIAHLSFFFFQCWELKPGTLYMVG
jgi:hypothetical protein